MAEDKPVEGVASSAVASVTTAGIGKIEVTAANAGAVRADLPKATIQDLVAQRGSSVNSPAAKATEGELNDIEMAIDHPPKQADHFGTAVSVIGVAAIIAKTIASPVDHFGPKDLSVIIASALLGGAQIARYLSARFARTPIKDRAKKHIRQLKIAHGGSPEDEQVSNWQRLRELLWRKVFAFLGDNKS